MLPDEADEVRVLPKLTAIDDWEGNDRYIGKYANNITITEND